MVLIKVVYPFEIDEDSKCYGPILTGSSFASTSDVLTLAILELLKLRDYKTGFKVTFSGMTCPLNFM
jgi:hypothetical protein